MRQVPASISTSKKFEIDYEKYTAEQFVIDEMIEELSYHDNLTPDMQDRQGIFKRELYTGHFIYIAFTVSGHVQFENTQTYLTVNLDFCGKFYIKNDIMYVDKYCDVLSRKKSVRLKK